MDRKPYPFSDLTERELDAIIDRARRERTKAIAAAFTWLRQRIATTLAKPTRRPSAAGSPAIHHQPPNLQPR